MFEPLRADLETALLRALRGTWSDLNQAYFKGALKPPAITLSDGTTRLGQWERASRTLSLSRALVADAPWGQVVEVLKHELLHQYVCEALGEPDETAHGPTFRALGERLGIDARASGTVAGTGSHILQRVAKLLALAESANEHEAELAMAEAQRLMLKHNLEVPASEYHFRHLGTPSGRTQEHERILAGILGDHFFVEAIWVPVWRAREGKRGSVLEVVGAPVNLEMAAYAHAFLLATGERLWHEYRRARGITNNVARRAYLAGVMTGFREKLDRERARQKKEGLIWVGDGDLRRFFRRRHPHIRMARYFAGARDEAHAEGRNAGRNLVLHRPLEAAPSTGGRLLPARR